MIEGMVWARAMLPPFSCPLCLAAVLVPAARGPCGAPMSLHLQLRSRRFSGQPLRVGRRLRATSGSGPGWARREAGAWGRL